MVIYGTRDGLQLGHGMVPRVIQRRLPTARGTLESIIVCSIYHLFPVTFAGDGNNDCALLSVVVVIGLEESWIRGTYSSCHSLDPPQAFFPPTLDLARSPSLDLALTAVSIVPVLSSSTPSSVP